MDPGNNILLGKITGVHGKDGTVTVKVIKDFSEDIPELESVFLEIEGIPVPFFIEYIELINPGTIHIKFEDYDNISKVSEFTGSSVLIPNRADFNNNRKEGQALTGYKVFSDSNNSVGIIEEIIQNPGQWLFKVRSGEKDYILVPVHEDLIVEINHENRIVRMIIPDGLTDINHK
jgi:16S rRNA processing protein RimM